MDRLLDTHAFGSVRGAMQLFVCNCVLIVLVTLPFPVIADTQPFWTWVAGSDLLDQNGTYGTPGVVDSDNTPGGRRDASTWTGGDGSFWLFGGFGYDAEGSSVGHLNDLWRFDLGAEAWVHVHGPTTIDDAGVFGTPETPAADNVPPARRLAATWTDSDGRLWLFGGERTSEEPSSDLWVFDPAINQWAWIGGPSEASQYGVYDEINVASDQNLPGARYNPVSWVGPDENLWLFGGLGFAGSGNIGRLNDIWNYNPETKEWTWVKGSDESNPSGVYGTPGQPAPENTPGGRDAMAGWAETNGTVWIFAGVGINATGNFTNLSDLWRFNPTTREWTWISGTASALQPSYGDAGEPSPDNTPGRRQHAATWTDADGLFWFSSGFGNGPFNDLWVLDSSTGFWTWMAGAEGPFGTATYGAKGVAAPGNIAGARSRASSWVAPDGTLWMFGGVGYTSSPSPDGMLNDLWKLPTTDYTPDQFTLTYIAGENGSLTGNTIQTVLFGMDGTPVQAFPDMGYNFQEWSDGSTDNPRVDTLVEADINVTALFGPNFFSLFYTAGPGGSVVGETLQDVPFGSDGTPVEAVPASGYRFVEWSDGLTENPRIDREVSELVNVEAIFELIRSDAWMVVE